MSIEAGIKSAYAKHRNAWYVAKLFKLSPIEVLLIIGAITPDQHKKFSYAR